MKFYRRHSISESSPQDNSWAVEADGRIVTNSTNSMETPRGDASQRPSEPVNGSIRYNTELGLTEGGELEVYVDGKWEIIKTNRQQVITKQIFENGDYADTIFGPLSYNVDVTKPENVFVYVENVWQIPGLNYELVLNTAGEVLSTSTVLTKIAPDTTTTLYVSSVADFNPGQPLFGAGLSGNTVVETSSTSKTITISPGVFGTLSSGTSVLAEFPDEGTYVRFIGNSIPVPYKPVIVLQGFDGYGPPFEV